MPTKKNRPNISILTDENKFYKTKISLTQHEFEQHVKKLINVANDNYNKVFHSERQKHIEKFPVCKKNYVKIKELIDKDEDYNSILIKIYYLELTLACLQSDLNALDFSPKSKKELNSIHQNVKEIKLNFDKFDKSFNHLNSNKDFDAESSEAYDTLRTYRDKFSSSWSKDSNNLLATCYYNLAEENVEKKLLTKAIKYLKKAADYYNAAELPAFKTQTETRIKELESHKKLFSSLENTNSLWATSYKEASDKLTTVVDQPILLQSVAKKIDKSDKIKPNRCKRKAFNNNIKPAKKIRYEIECTKLLNKFEQIGIKKYNLIAPSRGNELFRVKASLATKFALDIIKNLNCPDKNLPDTEKLSLLQQALNGLSKSITFCGQAGLVKEKGKVMQCSNILTSLIEKLNTSANKTPIKEQECHTKPMTRSEKLLEYQGIYSERLAYKFFNISFSEGDTQTTNPQNTKKISTVKI